jgi:hypothetical protein
MKKKKLNLEISEIGPRVDKLKLATRLPGGPCGGPCGELGIEGYDAGQYALSNALGISAGQLKVVHAVAAYGVLMSSEAGTAGILTGFAGFCGACHVALALQ